MIGDFLVLPVPEKGKVSVVVDASAGSRRGFLRQMPLLLSLGFRKFTFRVTWYTGYLNNGLPLNFDYITYTQIKPYNTITCVTNRYNEKFPRASFQDNLLPKVAKGNISCVLVIDSTEFALRRGRRSEFVYSSPLVENLVDYDSLLSRFIRRLGITREEFLLPNTESIMLQEFALLISFLRERSEVSLFSMFHLETEPFSAVLPVWPWYTEILNGIVNEQRSIGMTLRKLLVKAFHPFVEDRKSIETISTALHSSWKKYEPNIEGLKKDVERARKEASECLQKRKKRSPRSHLKIDVLLSDLESMFHDFSL